MGGLAYYGDNYIFYLHLKPLSPSLTVLLRLWCSFIHPSRTFVRVFPIWNAFHVAHSYAYFRLKFKGHNYKGDFSDSNPIKLDTWLCFFNLFSFDSLAHMGRGQMLFTTVFSLPAQSLAHKRSSVGFVQQINEVGVDFSQRLCSTYPSHRGTISDV